DQRLVGVLGGIGAAVEGLDLPGGGLDHGDAELGLGRDLLTAVVQGLFLLGLDDLLGVLHPLLVEGGGDLVAAPRDLLGGQAVAGLQFVADRLLDVTAVARVVVVGLDR